jgi:hypothetical protein
VLPTSPGQCLGGSVDNHLGLELGMEVLLERVEWQGADLVHQPLGFGGSPSNQSHSGFEQQLVGRIFPR